MRRADWLVFAAVLLACPAAGVAQPPGEPDWKLLPRPAEGRSVLDLARMIAPADAKKIQALSARLQANQAVPIVVMTIRSMAEYGAKGMRIETFARRLFDCWGIGEARVMGMPWNKGILLLVAKVDRKARIELGAGWGHDKDAACRKIMDEQIIPSFKKGQFSAGILAGAGALEQMVRAPELPGPRSAPCPADRFCYIPPDVADRVRFYHSFERGADSPEIDLLGGKVSADAEGWCDAGLTGRGYRIGKLPTGKPAAKRGLTLRDVTIGLNRPVTVSMWWRLDEPMKAETCFHLIGLHAQQGYLSNFVRGKGGWCALTRPTFVVQVYRFAGIADVNGIRFGDAWVEHGKWHHAAVTVSAGSQVTVYWDGRPRSSFPVKGRLFTGKDVVRTISLGSSWLAHPMTIDEVLILDCAMRGEQIADYVTAVRKLAEMEFRFSSSRQDR